MPPALSFRLRRRYCDAQLPPGACAAAEAPLKVGTRGGTEWPSGETSANSLMESTARRGKMAFLDAWTVLSGGSGSGTDTQIRILERFLAYCRASIYRGGDA